KLAVARSWKSLESYQMYTYHENHHSSGYPNSVPISCGLYDFAWLRVPSKKNVTETIEARHAPLDTKLKIDEVEETKSTTSNTICGGKKTVTSPRVS
ncbi:hypothetical protein ALC60_07859, partial [Trachymyrmex zeteki]